MNIPSEKGGLKWFKGGQRGTKGVKSRMAEEEEEAGSGSRNWKREQQKIHRFQTLVKRSKWRQGHKKGV